MSGRRVVLLAPRGDAFAAALSRRLGAAAAWAGGPGFGATVHLESGADGAPRCTGSFVVDGQALAWERVSALVVRPFAAWSPRRRIVGLAAGFAAQEQRCAWAALMDAFPGPVANRLPPGWFLDRELAGAGLAEDLARAAGVALDAGLTRARGASGSAWVSGEWVFAGAAATPAAREFAAWLGSWSAALQGWQRRQGTPLLRLHGRRGAGGDWALRRVDIAPALAGWRDADLARAARALLEELA